MSQDIKLQPSGVVLPERWIVPRPIWKDARQPYGDPLNKSDIEAAEKFNLALDEVTRLNSPPVSATLPTVEQLATALGKVRCFHDLSAELIAPDLLENLRVVVGAKPVSAGAVMDMSVEQSMAISKRGREAIMSASAGWVDERAAEALEQAIGLIDLIEHHQPALDQARRILVKLAALTASAPNHSEQVREGWPAHFIDYNILNIYAERHDLSYNELCSMVRSCMLSAPSAGSQGGDV